MSKKILLRAGRPSTNKKPSQNLSSLSESNDGKKRVNFEVSFEQHVKLKTYAAKNGKTIKELLSEYVSTLTK